MKLRTARQSPHASALRLSLWVSLGLPLPVLVACGGSVAIQGDGVAGKESNAGSGVGAMGGRSGTGGTGGTGATSASGTGPAGSGPTIAGSGPVYPFCERPVFDPVSGLVNCLNGYEHRPKPVKCQPPPDLGEGGSAGEAGAGPIDPWVGCESDADCRYLPLGYCNTGNYLGGGAAAGAAPPPQCASGCLEDSDCGAGSICVCDGTSAGGKCVYSSCTADAECGPRQFCATAQSQCGGTTFACTTTADECLSQPECGNGQPCLLNGTHRTCGGGAVCGRPFLIDEAPRFAEVEPRADWLDATLSPDLSGLSPLQRAELAAHWSRLGQMEHASIAAFARFNLQMLALGAPGDLVEACNRALMDETAHAKVCFAFASAYAGTKLGPSKLDMSHCFEDSSLISITKLVIAEGCIGETVAALEAREDADRATDPVVKSALLRIAHDERNHAELAYRFVRWALSQLTTEERAELQREIHVPEYGVATTLLDAVFLAA